MNFTTKQIGLGIIILSLVLLLILIPISFKVAEIGMAECVHAANAACSITGHIPIESFVGIVAIMALAGFGAFLMFKVQRYEKLSKETLRQVKEKEKMLSGSEKAIYRIIADSSGALFQSEIVDRSGFTKTKVTRLLDKLEAKGIIERRRRGMTNMILLKTK